MKSLFLGAILFSTLSFGQVGINTSNPQGTLHVDAAKDNPSTGAPSVAQQLNDFTILPTGNVGIGTTSPSEHLDVASGNVRIRNINSNVGTNSDKLVATDANGILKIAGGATFSTTDSGNRVLRAQGGTRLTYQTDWTNNTFTNLLLNEAYDPLNAYDPATGEYVIPTDGLYTIYAACRFAVPSGGSGTFDGTSGVVFSSIFIDSGRVRTAFTNIFRGMKSPGANNEINIPASETIWLKAGQKITFQFLTYGTSNMIANSADLTLDRANSFIYINKNL